MEKPITILTTAQEVKSLENALNELNELSLKAFSVFRLRSLANIKKNFETSWNSLFEWIEKNRSLIHVSLRYQKIEKTFFDISDAYINRKEFENALKEPREKIEEAISKLQDLLCEKKETLNALYNEFAKNTGSLKFIFEEEAVKQLIIDNLLKS